MKKIFIKEFVDFATRGAMAKLGDNRVTKRRENLSYEEVDRIASESALWAYRNGHVRQEKIEGGVKVIFEGPNGDRCELHATPRRLSSFYIDENGEQFDMDFATNEIYQSLANVVDEAETRHEIEVLENVEEKDDTIDVIVDFSKDGIESPVKCFAEFSHSIFDEMGVDAEFENDDDDTDMLRRENEAGKEKGKGKKITFKEVVMEYLGGKWILLLVITGLLFGKRVLQLFGAAGKMIYYAWEFVLQNVETLIIKPSRWIWEKLSNWLGLEDDEKIRVAKRAFSYARKSIKGC